MPSTTTDPEPSAPPAEQDEGNEADEAVAATTPAPPTEPDATDETTDPEPEVEARPERDGRWITRVAIVLGVAPVLVAGVRGAVRGWTPTGDDAYSAVRAWDVFTSHIPLLGTWSSASSFTGHEINHPGPLQFDLLAVPVRLLGHGPGTAIGLALVNATAVALIGWLVSRRLGPAAAALAMGFSALLSWSMGSEMLYDPWSQYAPLVPFSLFVVAVWCVAAGDLVALPIMVVAGNYALQTHLSYTVLVPGLAAFGLVALGLGYVLERRRDRAAWLADRGSLVRWGLIALAVQLVVAAQPLYEQLTARPEGNVTALIRSRSAQGQAPTPPLGAALRALGGTVAIPPAWLPPSYRSPSFHLDGTGRPTGLAVAGLAALGLLLAGLAWRAGRRGARPVATGLVMALIALGLGLVTILYAPVRWGLAPTYLRWLWPLGMVIWLTVAVALLDEVRAWRRRDPSTRSTLLPGLAVPGLALAAVAAVAALPTVDNGSASPPWTVDAVHDVDGKVTAAVRHEPGVLVEMTDQIAVGATGPALFGSLQDAGVPFYVNDPRLVRQLGTGRAYHPGDATVRLSIRSGAADKPGPGERLVARSVPLSRTETAELRRLDRRVRGLVAENGLPLVDRADEVFAALGQPDQVQKIAALAHDPDQAVRSGEVRDLWSGAPTALADGPLLDPTVFPPAVLDRWSDLQRRHDDEVIHVYLSPLAAR
jgi:hypothetical protein